MDRVTTFSKRSKALGCILLIVFVYLSVNAFIAARYIDNHHLGYSSANVYLSQGGSYDASLASTINSESKSLEFMVWPQERRALSQALSQMVQQRIALDPFNGDLWLQLSYLQKDAGVNMNERAWTIERAARLLKWNINQRPKIGHYCVSEYTLFQQVIPALCSSLISNLPAFWTDSQKAAQLDVQLNDLKAVFELENAKRLNGATP